MWCQMVYCKNLSFWNASILGPLNWCLNNLLFSSEHCRSSRQSIIYFNDNVHPNTHWLNQHNFSYYRRIHQWFGLMALFHAKSSVCVCVYIYIYIYILSLVDFHGISTLGGYLMLNSVYTYINIWFVNSL